MSRSIACRSALGQTTRVTIAPTTTGAAVARILVRMGLADSGARLVVTSPSSSHVLRPIAPSSNVASLLHDADSKSLCYWRAAAHRVDEIMVLPAHTPARAAPEEADIDVWQSDGSQRHLANNVQFTKGKIHVFTASLRAPRDDSGRTGTTPKQRPIDSQAHMFKVLSALYTAASSIQGANSNAATPAAVGDNAESDGGVDVYDVNV